MSSGHRRGSKIQVDLVEELSAADWHVRINSITRAVSKMHGYEDSVRYQAEVDSIIN